MITGVVLGGGGEDHDHEDGHDHHDNTPVEVHPGGHLGENDDQQHDNDENDEQMLPLMVVPSSFWNTKQQQEPTNFSSSLLLSSPLKWKVAMTKSLLSPRTRHQTKHNQRKNGSSKDDHVYYLSPSSSSSCHCLFMKMLIFCTTFVVLSMVYLITSKGWMEYPLSITELSPRASNSTMIDQMLHNIQSIEEEKNNQKKKKSMIVNPYKTNKNKEDKITYYYTKNTHHQEQHHSSHHSTSQTTTFNNKINPFHHNYYYKDEYHSKNQHHVHPSNSLGNPFQQQHQPSYYHEGEESYDSYYNYPHHEDSDHHQVSQHSTNKQTHLKQPTTKKKFDDDFLSTLNPKIILLASFPNSGTSYTLENTLRVTNVTTASNYCMNLSRDHSTEIVRKPRPPLYANTSYWEYGPSYNLHPSVTTNKPNKYVMVKTHCGARCSDCSPQKYLISQTQFEYECFETCHEDPVTLEQTRRYAYDMKLVAKLVHLIRHPMDNVISRFHLQLKHQLRESNSTKYEKSPQGFLDYCRHEDFLSQKIRYRERHIYPKQLWKLAQMVPCHAELLKYIRWHDYILKMIRRHRKTQLTSENVLTLYYEDYTVDKFNQTVSNLVNFMEMEWIAQAEPFFFANYTSYYEPFLEDIHTFVKTAASSHLYPLLLRYFN